MADQPFSFINSIFGPPIQVQAQNNEAALVRQSQAQIGQARSSISSEVGQIIKANPKASPQEILRTILQSPKLADAFVNDPDSLTTAINLAKGAGTVPADPIKLGEGDTLLDPTTYKPIASGAGVGPNGKKLSDIPADIRSFEYFASAAGVDEATRKAAAQRKLMGDPSSTAEQISILKSAGVPDDVAAKVATGAYKVVPIMDQYGKQNGAQIMDLTDPQNPVLFNPNAIGGQQQAAPAMGAQQPSMGAPAQSPPAQQQSMANPPAGQPPSRQRVIMVNQGATRDRPLAPSLNNAFNAAANAADLDVRVYSGGQAKKGEIGGRVGSTRHDAGNAADVYLSRNGRVLDPSNPADRDAVVNFVKASIANGVNGIGQGEGYMGKGIHLGYGPAGEQGGPVTIWGAGGKGKNAPNWLRRAVSEATQGKFVEADHPDENNDGSETNKSTAPDGLKVETPPQGVLGDKSEAFLSAGLLGTAASTAEGMAQWLKPDFKFPGAAGAAGPQTDALQQMALSLRELKPDAGDEYSRAEFKQLQDSAASIFGNWTGPTRALEGVAGWLNDAQIMYDKNLQVLNGGGQSMEEVKRARANLNRLDSVLARWPTQEQVQNQLEKIKTGEAETTTLQGIAKQAEQTLKEAAPIAQDAVNQIEGAVSPAPTASPSLNPNAVSKMTLQQIEALGANGGLADADAATLAALKARLREVRQNTPSPIGVPRTP